MLFPYAICLVFGGMGFGLIRVARSCMQEDYGDYNPTMGVLALYCVAFIFIHSGCVAAGSSVPPDKPGPVTAIVVVGPPLLDALAILLVPDRLAIRRRPKKKCPATRCGKRTNPRR